MIYDDVQYDKQGWRNRNRIKTAHGARWLTVPVRHKFDDRPRICDIIIDNRTSGPGSTFGPFGRITPGPPYLRMYIDGIEAAFRPPWERLVDLDLHFIDCSPGGWGLGEKTIVRSSDLGVSGDRTERLLRICKMFEADVFYEGAAGRNYLNEESFRREGIRVEYQDYRHPEYHQLHGEFLPYLSVVDLLLNTGPDALSIFDRRGDPRGGK